MARRQVEISVVAPVYGNALTLVELHRRLRSVMVELGAPYELVFVDDASRDDSLSVLQDLARHDPTIAVVALPSNVGQHAAVLAGLRHARGQTVVVLDADLQDPPEAIPQLTAKLRDGPAAVFATRRSRHDSPMRQLTSRLFKNLLRLLIRLPAGVGLFVAMDQRMVGHVIRHAPPRPFMLELIAGAGLPIAFVPVVRSARPEGGSSYSTRKRLRLGVMAISGILASRCRTRRPPE